MASITAAVGGGAWTVGSTWVGGSAPSAADDALLTVASGNVTIDAGAVCRSLDCNTYVGTLTHTSGVTLTVGDGTAGAGNRALRLVAGMTYTLGGNPSSAISFISTSATTQTVDYGSKNVGGQTFNGAGGSWSLSSAISLASTGTVTLTNGTLNTNSQTCSWGLFSSSNSNTRTLTLGASTITITGASTTVWNMATITGLTITSNTAVVTCSGATATFSGGGANFNGMGLVMSGSGVASMVGGNTFDAFTRTGTTVKTDSFVLSNSITVTSTLNLNGNSATNRLLVQSNAVGTSRTFTSSGSSKSWSNVDFMDIALSASFDASAITGGSGDADGNTNITFTPSATQTYTGGTGNWSDVSKWTSRVPLPQDDVSFAGVTGGTITADMPRLGMSISWVGASGSPAFSVNSSANCTMYGSLTLISAMTFMTVTGACIFAGRGSYTIDTAGVTIGLSLNVIAPTGTYTLQSAFVCTGASGLTITNGGFNANNFNVTIPIFTMSSTNTKSLTMGTGIWSITSTALATVWTVVSTGTTFSGAASTLVISTASANTRTLACGGVSYGTLTYTVAGSTGTLQVINAGNSFDTINFSDISNARTLLFSAGTTTTVNNFNVFGTSGKLMSVASTTAATHTLSKASGTVNTVDYVNLTNSIATGGAAWYAGANSTDSGGNTGWIFTAAPVVSVAGAIGEPFIIRSQDGSAIMEYIRRKGSGSLRNTVGDSWKAYLSAGGGTGNSFGELESSWLASLGFASAGAYASSLGYTAGNTRENIRAMLLNA